MCGGTRSDLEHGGNDSGLSPRVRGNRDAVPLPQVALRSIPACAGEPRPSRSPACPWTVYPRVCGGTGPPTANALPAAGLSPRVRGNRQSPAPSGCASRSIPACAGEPCRLPYRLVNGEVYPRVCGGTLSRPAYDAERRGLSPRVRGNRHSSNCRRRGRWSIPACAGEPSARGGIGGSPRGC